VQVPLTHNDNITVLGLGTSPVRLTHTAGCLTLRQCKKRGPLTVATGRLTCSRRLHTRTRHRCWAAQPRCRRHRMTCWRHSQLGPGQARGAAAAQQCSAAHCSAVSSTNRLAGSCSDSAGLGLDGKKQVLRGETGACCQQGAYPSAAAATCCGAEKAAALGSFSLPC
jgi:hypothetical protein